jgi:hypothetical protein
MIISELPPSNLFLTKAFAQREKNYTSILAQYAMSRLICQIGDEERCLVKKRLAGHCQPASLPSLGALPLKTVNA